MGTHNESLNALSEYLESPKGIAETREYWAKFVREDERLLFRVNQLNDYQETLTDKEFTKQFKRFVKWEDKYAEMWYLRGILTNSNILSVLWKLFLEYGTELEVQEPFLGSKHELRGFTMAIYHGQGSVIRITYKGETIL